LEAPSPEVGKSSQPFVNNEPSKEITEVFQKYHENKELSSILDKKIYKLRLRLRVAALQDIPEYKPILSKS
jgi:hypothetical protein